MSFAVSFAVSRLEMASRLFQKTTLAYDPESKTQGAWDWTGRRLVACRGSTIIVVLGSFESGRWVVEEDGVACLGADSRGFHAAGTASLVAGRPSSDRSCA